jgi:serine phosphatase RsbU (regulator of sigma subunit)/DNA-binding CsgD family transcriptional regulator
LVKEWLTESFIFYKPKDIVAGDFYWMETANYTENDKEKTLVYFAAADCTGHGVPGAMISVVCANALNRAIKEFNLIEPGQVLDKVSELVIEALDKGDESIKDGMDIALCALDISSKKVFYSGANNPLYRITTLKEKINTEIRTETNETHQLIEYKANKQPVGQHDNSIKFNTIEIQLYPGDAIYVFSDGFPDQFGGEKGKKYKYSSFRKTLLGNFNLSMEDQKKLLEKEFDNWKGDLEQIDDVCVIGVKINGVEKNNFTKRELEVLSHLQEGLPSKLIADKMNISTHTVDTYRRRLLAKTGTYNATELINYCIKKEII